jgi:hypothetical protein
MKQSWLVLVVGLLLSSITACGSDNSSSTSPATDEFVSSTISLGTATSGNSSNIIGFTVNKPGTISAEAIWTGTTGTLALILNGPGQVNAYARIDGPSPLSLKYDVTPSDVNKGALWTLTVINFYSGTANGSLAFTFPIN